MRPEAEKSLQLGPYGDGGHPEEGVEPPVVEITDGQANAQGAHGLQPPPLCEYEKLRERNIKEIEEAMKEIEDAKQDMRDNAPVAVKRKVEVDVDGRRNRKKVKPVMQLRRSGRRRKPVSYVVEDEGRKKKRARREESLSPARRVVRKPAPSPLEKPFKCSKCGVQFSLKAHLNSHTKTVHDQIRAFKCEHCDKSFGLAGDRKKHIEGVHFNIRYSCTWPNCMFTCRQKSYVKYHRRRAHTQEWSIECQLCEDQLDIWFGCISPGEMDKHRAKKHPGEWKEEQEAYKRDHSFVCKYKCDKRFVTKVEVERHERKMH